MVIETEKELSVTLHLTALEASMLRDIMGGFSGQGHLHDFTYDLFVDLDRIEYPESITKERIFGMNDRLDFEY